jgi:hypothetical protein
MNVTLPCWTLRMLAPMACLALIGSCLWAQGQQGLWQGLADLARAPWGMVTLGDLVGGFVITGCWMATLARWRALPWLILLPIVGNISTLAFVTWRCWQASSLTEAIRGGNELRLASSPALGLGSD